MTGSDADWARARRGTHLAVGRVRAFPGGAGEASRRLLADREGADRGPGGQGKDRGARQDRLREVGRGSTLNLAGAAGAAIATTGYTVIVTREFSKPVAGAFFTAISAFLIIRAVASAGSNAGLVYFIARLRSLGAEARIPAIMRAALLPVLAVSVLVAALMIVFAGPTAHLLLGSRPDAGTAAPSAVVAQALRALALTLPFAALLNAFLGASRGYHDMRPTAVIGQMGVSVAELAGVAIAAALGSAALLAPLWAVPFVPAAAVTWLWLRCIARSSKSRGPGLPTVPPELAALMALSTLLPPTGGARTAKAAWSADSRMARRGLADADPRGFWRFAATRGLASTAQNILQRIDIVLVASMRGPAEAAVYTAATRFLVIGQFGSTAITNAAQSRFTEFFAVGDRRGANLIYRATTAWMILLLWPLFLLSVIYGPQVLRVFGHSYGAGDAVIVILGLSMLVATACGQVDMVLITSGRSSWSLANGLLTVGVNVGVDLILIPRYGITGAAIGWAVAIVVSNLTPLAQLAAVLRLHPFGRATVIACLLSGLSFGIVPFALRTMLGGGAIALAAGTVIGCGLQAAGIWRFRRVLRLSSMPGLSIISVRRLRSPRPAERVPASR